MLHLTRSAAVGGGFFGRMLMPSAKLPVARHCSPIDPLRSMGRLPSAPAIPTVFAARATVRLLPALALAGALTIAVAPSAQAGTVWKCVGEDGVNAYVSQKVKPKDGDCTRDLSYPEASVPRPVSAHQPPDAQVQPLTTSIPGGPAQPPLMTAVPADAAPPPAQLPQAQALPPSASAVAASGDVVDYGDPNAAAVVAKLRDPNASFRYVQIGDSHTAGDFLTEELRARLQARLGDGGIGWAMPMSVPGQRLARVNFDYQGWALVNSRTNVPADYPFGGFIARVVADHAVLTMKSKQGATVQTVTAIIRQAPGDAPLTVSDADGRQQSLQSPAADGQWHSATLTARLPLVVIAEHSPGTAIGGWWLSGGQPGAIVSAVGINGSEQSQWDRWRSGWMQDMDPGQPDVIALAYGTNEAFHKGGDEGQVRADLESAIDRLRQRFPNAAVMLLGAPESLTSRRGSCGLRAPDLDAVQRIQKEVAASKRTLFWDWQQAMGGTCSMKRWIAEGLGRGDGVHFTAAGYVRLGDDLYQGLDGLAQKFAQGQVRRTPISTAQPCARAGAGVACGGAPALPAAALSANR